MDQLTLNEWSEFLSKCPTAHLLQTAQWGQLKSNFGWEVVRLVGRDDGSAWGAQILFRHLPLGYSFAYLPKGPLLKEEVGNAENSIPGPSYWKEVDQVCRKKRAIFLKIDPDGYPDTAAWDAADLSDGFQLNPHSIQPRRTLVVSLEGTEEMILARMKQKTRYNIRLAGKKDIRVEASDDVAAFYQLMEATGERDQFGIHTQAYYQDAYELFSADDNCALLIAEFQGHPVAGLMAFAAGTRSWYLYGASSSRHRERMPTYLLQWEAIKWARSKGCLQYDLYGIPDHDQEYLEANFQDRRDGLWGVYRFKRGFGGEILQAPESVDRVYNPLLYNFYLRWIERTSMDI